MNYELAKKLKDAGFPQKGFWFYGTNETDTPCLTYETNPFDTCGIQFLASDDTDIFPKIPRSRKIVLCYAPTLSELIEACGCKHENGNLFDLFFYRNEWRAEFVNGFGFASHSGKGKTPEEAVANLWLRLNSKSK